MVYGEKLVLCALAAAALSAEAVQTNYFQHGASDWCSPASYDDNRVPDANDVVLIGEGTTATISASDAESWAKANLLSRIIPAAKNARLVVEVTEGSAEFAIPFTAQNYAPAWEVNQYGTFEKTGEGELVLTGCNSLSASGHIYDYLTARFTVTAGTVVFQSAGSFTGWHFLGSVDVASGATLELPGATGADQTVTMLGLNGAGSVLNPVNRRLYVKCPYNTTVPAVFSGKLSGKILYSNVGGVQTFSGTASDFYGDRFEAGSGITALASFGSDGEPSSTGAGTEIGFTEGSATLAFAGSVPAGETVTAGKTIRFGAPAGAVSTLSAGDGGVVFTGSWICHAAGKPQQNVTLTGTNTSVEAGLACAIAGTWTGPSGAPCDITLTKTGSGIWRLHEHAKRFNAGVTAVRGGTLAVDSVEEAGRVSSIGLSTNLLDIVTGAAVTHAVELGAPAGSGVPAVFSYVGAKGASVSTRPIGLVGEGGSLRNDAEGTVLRWRGASVVEPGASPTLVLDGDSACTNEISDLSDGAGTLSVRKDGTGTWRLSGDLAFSGRLDVTGGRLLVRQLEPGPYTWHRWTIRRRVNESSLANIVQFEEFALYGADGVRCNLKLTEAACAADLKPGETAFATANTIAIQGGQLLAKAFDGGNSSGCRLIQLAAGKTTDDSTGWQAVDSANPYTAVPLVMRLPEGAAPAVLWDYMNMWAGNTSIEASTLEGSVDGLHWELLDAPEEIVPQESRNQLWAFSGVVNDFNGAAHEGARTIASASTRTYTVFPSGGTPRVRVSPGAELVAESAGLCLEEIEVGTDGGGTIDGFDFAEGGVLDIAAPDGIEDGTIPFSIVNTDTLDRFRNWSVTINGMANPRYVLRPGADGVLVAKRGLVIRLR